MLKQKKVYQDALNKLYPISLCSSKLKLKGFFIQTSVSEWQLNNNTSFTFLNSFLSFTSSEDSILTKSNKKSDGVRSNP